MKLSNNIQDFYNDFQFQIQTSKATIGGFEKNHFTESAVAKLSDAEEVSDVNLAQFEGVGKNRKKVLIDAYSFDDADDTVVLIASDFTNSETIETITQTELNATFDALTAFLEVVLDDNLYANLEHSSASGQAALDIRGFKSRVSKYRLYVLTNRALSARIKNLPSTPVAGVPVERAVWDIQRFYDAYKSVLSREDLDIDLTKWLPDGLPALRFADAHREDFETFLAVIPGDVLASIYAEFGSRLLEGNVRSFLSARGNVNKGIRATLITQPDAFLAYNNGLSSTANAVTYDSVSKSQVVLKSIQGFQIVNGGQTTVTLYNFLRFEKDVSENLKRAMVQMKLISVLPESIADLVPKISRYANTQNKVSEADFFANSPFHIRMEEISRRLIARPKPGETHSTKWFYERARGAYLNDKMRNETKAAIAKFEKEYPRNQVIDKTHLAKVFNVWNQKPHIVSRGAQKNFLEFAGQVADKYASETSRADYSDDFYRQIICKHLLFTAASKAIKKAEWYSTGYLANLVAYTVASLSHKLKTVNRDLDWAIIWQNQEVSMAFEALFQDLGKQIFNVFNDPRRPQVNISEWAKTEKCWQQAQEIDFELSSEVLKATVLVTAATKSIERQERRESGRALNEVELIKFLMSVEPDVWEAVQHSNRITVSVKEASIIKLQIKNRIVSESQARVLLALLVRCHSEGLEVPIPY